MRVLVFSYGNSFTAPYTDEICHTIESAGVECILVETSAVGGFTSRRFRKYNGLCLYLSEQGLDSLPVVSCDEYTDSCANDVDFLGIRSLDLFRRNYELENSLFDPHNYEEGRFRFLALRVESILRTVRPDLVCIAHGADPWTKIVTAKSRLHNIPCTYWESSFFPGRVLFDIRGPHFLPGASDMSDADKYSVNRESQELQAAAEFIDTWSLLSISKHRQLVDLSMMDIFNKFKINFDSIIFVPIQLPWDAAVFGSAIFYANIFEFFFDIVESVEKNIGIVFKVHPYLDKDFDWSPYDYIFDRPNVLRVSDVPIWELIRISNVIVTFSSNVGLEAAMLGKPVVVGGAPVYAGRGFTLDRTDDNTLYNVVNLAMGAAPDKRQVIKFVSSILQNNLFSTGDSAAMKQFLSRALALERPRGSTRAPFEEFDPPAARKCLANIRQRRIDSIQGSSTPL